MDWHTALYGFLTGVVISWINGAWCRRKLKRQRSWFLSLLAAEYGYWKSIDEVDPGAGDVQIGALGAVSNVMAAVNGHPAQWHPPEVPRKDGSK